MRLPERASSPGYPVWPTNLDATLYAPSCRQQFESLPATVPPSQSNVDLLSPSSAASLLWVIVAIAIITIVVPQKGCMFHQFRVRRPQRKALHHGSSANRSETISSREGRPMKVIRSMNEWFAATATLLCACLITWSSTVKAMNYSYTCPPSEYTSQSNALTLVNLNYPPPAQCSSVGDLYMIFNAYLTTDLPPGYTGRTCFNSVLTGLNSFSSTMCYDFVAGALDKPISERNPSEIAHYDASKYGNGSRIGVMTYNCTGNDNVCAYWGSYSWSMTVEQSGANMPLPDFSWTWEASTYQVDAVDMTTMLLYGTECAGYPVSQKACEVFPQGATSCLRVGPTQLCSASSAYSTSTSLNPSTLPPTAPSTSTSSPSEQPSLKPSASPFAIASPTATVSLIPLAVPSLPPSTATPSTLSPTRTPSKTPSSDPSYAPSIVPSTAAPSSFPSSWLYVNVTPDDYTIPCPRCLTDKKLDCPTLTMTGQQGFIIYYVRQSDAIEACKNAITFFSRLHQGSIVLSMNKTQLTGESSSLVLKYELVVPYGDPQVAYNYSSAYEAYVTINSTVTDAVSSGNFSLFMNTFPGIHVESASMFFEPFPATASPASAKSVSTFTLSPTSYLIWLIVGCSLFCVAGISVLWVFFPKKVEREPAPRLTSLNQFVNHAPFPSNRSDSSKSESAVSWWMDGVLKKPTNTDSFDGNFPDPNTQSDNSEVFRTPSHAQSNPNIGKAVSMEL